MDSWTTLVSLFTLWALFTLFKQSGWARLPGHKELPAAWRQAQPQSSPHPQPVVLREGFLGFDQCPYKLPAFGAESTNLNLLTERDHQLNCRLKETVLEACGLSYRSHTILVEFTQQNLTVTIDGRKRPPSAKNHYHQTWDDSAAFIERETFPGVGDVMVVSTPLLILRLQAVQPVLDMAEAEAATHLELALTLLAKAPEGMHGLIGQTLRSAGDCPPAEKAWQFQGAPDEYLVRGLTARESAELAYMYNQFSREHLSPDGSRLPTTYDMLSQPLVAYSAGVNRMLASM